MIGKREFVFFLGLLLVLNLIVLCSAETLAPSSPDGSPVATDDMTKIQGAVDQIPIDPNGNLNTSGFVGWKSQAELRIEAINTWLSTNAVWLKVVFGMVPEISWLFALDIYFFLLLLSFALNGFPFFYIFKDGYSKLAAVGLWIIFIVTKIPYGIAKTIDVALTLLVNWFWNKEWVIGLVLLIITIVLLILIAIYSNKMIISLAKIRRLKKRQEELEKEQLNRETLDAVVKGIQEGSKLK